MTTLVLNFILVMYDIFKTITVNHMLHRTKKDKLFVVEMYLEISMLVCIEKKTFQISDPSFKMNVRAFLFRIKIVP